MNYRVLRSIVTLLLLAAVVCPLSSQAKAKKVLVLGIDGMDPKLLQTFLDEGMLPNFERLIAEGDYKPLQTSMPPQSPVAWSTFITGMDPGGHGIFDFVHRDPETLLPYLSMSSAVPAEKAISVGSWVLPLSSGRVDNLRKGRAFWQLLEERGVPTTIFRMPANFPPAPSTGKSFSGMGTPDILGTPGTFSFYTNDPPENADEITGGKVYEVELSDNRVGAQLVGPRNTFRRVPKKTSRFRAQKKIEYENPRCTIDFTVVLDVDVERIPRVARHLDEVKGGAAGPVAVRGPSVDPCLPENGTRLVLVEQAYRRGGEVPVCVCLADIRKAHLTREFEVQAEDRIVSVFSGILR